MQGAQGEDARLSKSSVVVATPGNGSEARKFPRICLAAASLNPSITHSLEKLHAARCFRDPPTMSAIWNLHCLYSLDPSSPGFVRRLHSLFRYDDEERCLSRLQGSELTRLLDFLDRVCTLLSTLSSYETSSADSRRPPSQRRYFYTMFTQTTSHLRPSRGPTTLVLRIW